MAATEGKGVVFQPGDHAGVVRRLIASAIDGLVLFVGWVVLVSLWISMAGVPGITPWTLGPAWMLTAFAYVVLLKRSRLRTLGYRLAGLRVVDLRGGCPGLLPMTIRGGLYLLGVAPLDVLSLFLGGRPRRKLTDRVAGTWVVRAEARPVGHSNLVTAYVGIFGHFWVIPSASAPDLPIQEAA